MEKAAVIYKKKKYHGDIFDNVVRLYYLDTGEFFKEVSKKKVKLA